MKGTKVVRNRILLKSILALVSSALQGCTNGYTLPQTAPLSAASEDGIHTTKSAQPTRFSIEMTRIDAEYPGPATPIAPSKEYKVQSVSPDGALLLVDSRRIFISGIDCTSFGVEQLSKMLLSKDVSVSFVDIEQDRADATTADLWMTSSVQVEGRRVPTYVLLAEMAITSGWCIPSEKSQGQYYQRYLAIKRLSDEVGK